MKTTPELIRLYFLSLNYDIKEPSVDGYDLDGSIITINYSYSSDWVEGFRPIEFLKVELLDYITFVCQL